MNWTLLSYKCRESSMLSPFLRFLGSWAEGGWPPVTSQAECLLLATSALVTTVPSSPHFSCLSLAPSSFIPQSICLRWQISTERLRGLSAIIEQQEKIQNQVLGMIFVQDFSLCGRNCLCSLGACSLMETSLFSSLSPHPSGTTHFLPLKKLPENSFTLLPRPISLSSF